LLLLGLCHALAISSGHPCASIIVVAALVQELLEAILETLLRINSLGPH
jgi:hypothetical protein